jgi:hypothetical protein
MSEHEFENLDVVADEEVHKVRVGRFYIPMKHAIKWIESVTTPSPGDIVTIAVRESHGVVECKAEIVNYHDDRVLI